VAQQRLPVRKIREVLRLKAAGFSDRKIAATIGSARSTVQECVRRAQAAAISWPLTDELDESALHAQLYRRSVPLSRHPAPDFAQLHAELARPGVTRLLLWQEYKAARPDGWQYSVFCDRYRRWLATQELVLRQNHAPGEKLFVDYAGQSVPIVDRHTGRESRRADLRRRARLLELHLCRGHLDASAARLARQSRAGARVYRRRTSRHGAG
jgi:transposase